MKKIILGLAATVVLSGCSSDPEKLKTANDTFQKSEASIPGFSPLATGGVNLPIADNTYALPNIAFKKGENIDIRPPSTPLAIIQNSLTQFDGERALIVYPEEQTSIYNLKQVERLLKEENISSTVQGSVLTTDWSPTDRIGDKNVEIKYQIEHVTDRSSSALAVSVLQTRRDGIIFTPSTSEKQRYTSDRLNRLIYALTSAYTKQQQDLSNASVGAISSHIIQDLNGQIALAMNTTFNQAWEKLGYALPKVGFAIKSETSGRGYRELKYSSLNKEDWLRLGIESPKIDNGIYNMQISDHGKQSSMVISDEKGHSLSGDDARKIYQAISNIISR